MTFTVKPCEDIRRRIGYGAILWLPYRLLARWLPSATLGRASTETLRAVPAKAARVELVLQRAQVNHVAGYGVSWFVEGCGGTAQRAREAWSEAFGLALTVIMDAHRI